MHVNVRTFPDLGAAQLGKAMRHARTCDRCRAPVERAILAARALEQGSPWEPTAIEIEAIGRRGLPELRRMSDRRTLWHMLAAFGVAATAAVLLWVRSGEFKERGTGEGRAVLRMFCASPAPGGVQELPPGGRCTGHALAFAAGARAELTSVALQLRDAEGTRILGPFPVTGRPGAETPLEITPGLRGPGTLEVTAAFASSPEAALASVVGAPSPGVVILRQSAVSEPR
jgi:hypothetical protein